MSAAGFYPAGPSGGAMHLWPEEDRAGDLGVVRACRIERDGVGPRPPAATLWFSLPDTGDPPCAESGEPFLLAALVHAMAERRDLVLHGAASAELLGNLLDFRDAYCRWAPERYAPIAIGADTVTRRGAPRLRGAGVASGFSGGVDSHFTLWWHASGLAGHRARRITHAAFVHGFDIPLDAADAFEAACGRSRPVLADVGVELVPIRTNFRKVLPYHWEQLYGAALAACLHQLAPRCGEGLIASSRSYDELVFPIGSNAITDPLLSSASMTVREDGAGHVRAEKVAILTGWPEGAATLRVCWQGQRYDRNCGACEKCIRTALTFFAIGRALPASFHRTPTIEEIEGVQLTSEMLAEEWRQLLRVAERTGTRSAELTAAHSALKRAHRGAALRRVAGTVARAAVPRRVRRLLNRWVGR